MARPGRLLRNLFAGWFQLGRRFPPGTLDEIARAIAAGERTHLGEVRLAVESRLAPAAVLAGTSARQRAEQVFAQLRVWDTEHNTGVLLYVLMAEHRIEIVADRGIARKVGQAAWDEIAARMGGAFAQDRWREGCLEGIGAVHALLARHFPAEGRDNPDELPDRPVLL
ncbi:TPM domain-containing protein [Fulvimonas soli]|jgi:uncharacterized membrane protein|uniref:Putative membrane protein n=1 Tax=Fulvimonas soli TaxID=155197 RepID=A0A316HWK5_9GAMM|nr:TPM domain-containing protein [Fulvimonas soli]PWK84771.1 putative membrane protein [Fulvimonas soli]TNY26895.1 hypothetical protein BV497_06590 [Fulvimonas soli]